MAITFETKRAQEKSLEAEQPCQLCLRLQFCRRGLYYLGDRPITIDFPEHEFL
jgi:hypothetical protein